jgi:CHAT domain-containing protein
VTAYHSSNENHTRSLPDDLERSGSIQYLQGSGQEVEDIKQQADKVNIPVTVLSGINATEESFKALNGKASPSVLHIATHGFFFPDPKADRRDSIQRLFESSGKVFKQSDNPLFRSGLLFAGANNAWQGKSVDGIDDGIVTAFDVSNMYLPNTKLVVLSACETALGEVQGREGVYGLQRAFKMAGAQNLVMSLWKVRDTETAEFMQLFYKDLFDRQSISDAFYHAQTEMKVKYRNEPVKWAAWVLVR